MIRALIFIFLVIPFLSFGQFGEGRYIGNYINYPQKVHSTDIDGDGDFDVIAVSANGRAIFLYENIDGEGTFGESKIISSGNFIADTQVIDFDLDGDFDVIAADFYENQLYLFENFDGLGNIWNKIIIAESDAPFSSTIAIDVDEDGDLDIIGANYHEKLVWFENMDGQGDLGNEILIKDNFSGLNTIYSIDFDNDNDEDIFSNRAAGTIFFFENLDNDDGFEEQTIPSSAGAKQFNFKDIDGDNDLDILSYLGSQVVWSENIDGDLTTFQNLISSNFGEIHSTNSIDFDNDGDSDILVGSVEALVLYENLDGAGSYSEAIILSSSPSPFFYSIEILDFNNDNYLDILTCTYIDDEVLWFANENGTGSFTRNSISDGFPHPNSIHFADLDADGDKDLLASSEHNERIVWHENLDGNGVFGGQNLILEHIPNTRVHWGDINNDNYNDIVTITSEHNLSWFDNTNGNANFELEHVIDDDIIANDYNQPFAADIDNDNDLDIVLFNFHGADRGWYENLDGQGNFSSQKTIPAPFGSVYKFKLADFDNDNDLDIVAHNYNDEAFWVAFDADLNEFNTSFEEIVPSDFELGWIESGDFDGDSDEDIIFLSLTDKSIWWVENINNMTGNGAPVLIGHVGFDVESILPMDVDLDNDLDIIVSGIQSMWFENNGTGTFTNKAIFTQAYSSIAESFDFDNDGDLDIFAGGSGQIIYFENYLIDNNPRIQGTVFLDENQNSIFDPNEIGLNQQAVSINPNPLQSWTTGNGQFDFRVEAGTNQIICESTDDWQFTTEQFYILEAENQEIITQDFGLIPNGVQNEAQISLASAPTRCGFTVPFWLTFENLGNQKVDATITLELDPTVIFNFAQPAPTEINGTILTWHFEDFNPTHSDNIYLNLEMPGVEALGDFLEFNSQIIFSDDTGNQLVTDEHIYTPQVNCAYDPNDKLVDPNLPSNENYTLFGDTLIYTVRFQNTGTDTAFTVRIEDVLDNNLDWETFRFIASSHDCVTFMNPNGKVIFQFDNILLPDSTTNEIASHGFVQYQILPKGDLEEMTEIENEASIFFDFNPPIITNTITNLMVSEFPLLIYFQHPKCADSEDGLIEILGHNETFSYQWDNGNSGNTLNELGVGNYELSVYDTDNQLVADTTITLTAPLTLIINPSSESETNEDMNGAASVEISGGVPPYFYEWNTTPIQTTPEITNLSAGFYEVTITDSNGCQKIETIEVDKITNTNEAFADLIFEISPNPTSNKFQIKIQHPNLDWQLKIQSIEGKFIESINNKNAKKELINLKKEGLAAGIYFVSLEIGEMLITKKLVVTK